jgi:hypothetical protein
MQMMRVELLPESPLGSAAAFHADWLAKAQAMLATGDDLTLIFPPADHTHRGWRLSVVQSLAREHAPLRVNAVESDEEAAIAATCVWLTNAPGVTGQYLPLDGTGAGLML